eukprot:TRINITY_DN227_c0_g1_i3.p1 TRINITY_DN227_c0_g1~~TRINITY_DN227_c0_g1_i3.p1  ORF type:complete len:1179 (+),score=80.12 TRINITY_DN227_c0_g1_i3:654-4190(+)
MAGQRTFRMLVIFLIAFPAISHQAKVVKHQAEWLATTFANSFGGNPVTTFGTWKSYTDCSAWAYVQCDDFGYATAIDLSYGSLYGSLPQDGWANMTSLTALRLSNNHLTGNIPSQMGVLVNLETLEMYQAYLTGHIPATFGSLHALNILDLSSNSLVGGLPSELGKLGNLTNLNIDGNAITGSIPESFGGLSLLTTFKIGRNFLNGPLPTSLQKLKQLQDLDIEPPNYITGALPTNIGGMSNLQTLTLIFQNLSGPIPSSICKLSRLGSLYLAGNSLTGAIPSCIGQVTNLYYLDLSFNLLTGSIPQSIGGLTVASQIYLNNNQLSNSLPASFGQLNDTLDSLNLGNNFLTGSIPPEFGNMSVIETLVLSANFLSGAIPSTFGDLTTLTTLNLDRNRLTGTIPLTLAKLVKLSSFTIQVNELTGRIPSIFKKMTSLSNVYLSSNYFVGSPVLVFPTTSNLVIDISFNFLTSPVDFSTTDNKYICPLDNGGSDYSNCLFNEDRLCTKEKQKSQATCTAFCNALQPNGACGGHGSCVPSTTGSPGCACDDGYSDAYSKNTCKKTIVTSLSLGLLPPSTTSFSKLGTFFRHASAGFLYSHQRTPIWSIAQSWNWILESAVLPPRDQGACGACWAMASLGAIESAVYITSGGKSLPALSVQQLVDCQGADSCLGGWPGDGFQFAATTSVALERSYPYKAVSQTCPKKLAGAVQIQSFEQVSFYGWFGLLLAVQQQPVVVYVEGSSPSFQAFPGGYIYADEGCYLNGVDHSVLVVGYDLTTTPQSWIIQNSWGLSWGEFGYMRMAIIGGVGICGINTVPGTYPVIKGNNACNTGSYGPVNLENTYGPGFVNPCGGGTCTPVGTSGNTCKCSRNFVAKSNSDGTQTCVPSSPCSFFTSNPCKVGTCVNVESSPGDYSCICPLGFVVATMATNNLLTCITGVVSKGLQSYTVPKGLTLTCATVANAYGIASAAFAKQQSKRVNCKKTLQGGTVLNVTTARACALPYTINEKDTCKSIAALFGLPSAAAVGGASSPNPNLDCKLPLAVGQQICLKTGSSPLDVPLCTSYYTAQPGDTCHSIIGALFKGSATKFFLINPGFNCAAIRPPTDGGDVLGTEICTAASNLGTIKNGCGARNRLYSVKRGDHCLSLLRTFYKKSQVVFKKFNKGARCLDNNLVVGQSLCRP